MSEYHKIQTIFKRDDRGNLLEGEWTLPEFEMLKDIKWYGTEKVDGTNVRLIVSPDGIQIRGKTDRAQMPPDLNERLWGMFGPVAERLKTAFPIGAVFYGEGYGPKINKGGKYRDDPGFVLFDVRLGPWWLTRQSVAEIAQEFLLDVVPVVFEGSLSAAVEAVRGGIVSAWGGFQAEGLVLRPAHELALRNGHRVICKLKTKDFLTCPKAGVLA